MAAKHLTIFLNLLEVIPWSELSSNFPSLISKIKETKDNLRGDLYLRINFLLLRVYYSLKTKEA